VTLPSFADRIAGLVKLEPKPELEGVFKNAGIAYVNTLDSENSRRTMRYALEIVAAIASNNKATLLTLPWHELRREHTLAIRAHVVRTYPKANTVNLLLSALRGALKESWRLGLMSHEVYQAASDLKPAPGDNVDAGRMLESDELTRLFQACDTSTPDGARDAAVIALLFGGGLRRAEVASLLLEEIEDK